MAQPGPGRAVGPAIAQTNTGWAIDHGGAQITPDAGVTVRGDTRIYLVEDFHGATWPQHQYVRLDLRKSISFDLDLSGVPCGCLACVYLVAMSDPGHNNYLNKDVNNYCDVRK